MRNDRLSIVIETYVHDALVEASKGTRPELYSTAHMLALLALAATELARLENDLDSAQVHATIGAVEKPVATVKCRHDYSASEATGGNPPLCAKCGAFKKANGRPRRPEAQGGSS